MTPKRKNVKSRKANDSEKAVLKFLEKIRDNDLIVPVHNFVSNPKIVKIVQLCLRIKANFSVRNNDCFELFKQIASQVEKISKSTSQDFEIKMKELEEKFKIILENLPLAKTAAVNVECSDLFADADDIDNPGDPPISKESAGWDQMKTSLVKIHEQLESPESLDDSTFALIEQYNQNNRKIYESLFPDPITFLEIREKLDHFYKNPWDYIYDIAKLSDNYFLFYKKSPKILAFWENILEDINEQINKVMIKDGYCCGNAYKYKGREFKCHGQSGCLIKEGQVFYSYECYSFCQSCFDKYIVVVDFLNGEKVPKTEFEKELNRLECRESMVECKICKREVHAICMNHYGKIDKDIYCAKCQAKHKWSAVKLTSRLLPETKCSKYLERHFKDVVKSLNGNVELASKIYFRIVADSIVNAGAPKPEFSKFSTSQITYRNRVIMAFLEVENNEIAFFGIHVHLYPEKSYPDSQCAYLAYIDSVLLIEDSAIRKQIYRAILISLFSYLAAKGIEKVFIWTCPPQSGDDYIFNCKPSDQKTLQQIHLRQWYLNLFQSAEDNGGAVDGHKSIMEYIDEFRTISVFDSIPYFEGDLWSTKIEECLQACFKELHEFEIEPLAALFAIQKVDMGLMSKNAKNYKRNKEKLLNSEESYCFNNRFYTKLFENLQYYNDYYFVLQLKPVDDPDEVVDDEALIECEMFSRTKCLKYCIQNCIEFSSERRAINATKILLYHQFVIRKICYVCGASYENAELGKCRDCVASEKSHLKTRKGGRLSKSHTKDKNVTLYDQFADFVVTSTPNQSFASSWSSASSSFPSSFTLPTPETSNPFERICELSESISIDMESTLPVCDLKSVQFSTVSQDENCLILQSDEESADRLRDCNIPDVGESKIFECSNQCNETYQRQEQSHSSGKATKTNAAIPAKRKATKKRSRKRKQKAASFESSRKRIKMKACTSDSEMSADEIAVKVKEEELETNQSFNNVKMKIRRYQNLNSYPYGLRTYQKTEIIDLVCCNNDNCQCDGERKKSDSESELTSSFGTSSNHTMSNDSVITSLGSQSESSCSEKVAMYSGRLRRRNPRKYQTPETVNLVYNEDSVDEIDLTSSFGTNSNHSQ